jgi:hypothetical protein
MAAVKALSRGEGPKAQRAQATWALKEGLCFVWVLTYDVCNLDYEPTGSEGSGGEFLILPRMRR